MSPIPVVDIFAGPGGLNEGFSRLGEQEGRPQFRTIGSFEMESSACRTLELRSTFRQLHRSGNIPDAYYEFIRGNLSLEHFKAAPNVAEAFEHARGEVHQIELGLDREKSDKIIRHMLHKEKVAEDDPWALIGGPPCQAYSLAGRSRRANDEHFEDDIKHFLYREYLHILTEFAPPVFVMENVKGLLSSSHSGIPMFQRIKADLENPGAGIQYDIHSLTVDTPLDRLRPSDYLIRSEEYGIPQKRHRVILLGIRRGAIANKRAVGMLTKSATVSVNEAIGALPALRSGISPARLDDRQLWLAVRDEISNKYRGLSQTGLGKSELNRGGPFVKSQPAPSNDSNFRSWVSDPKLGGYIQHETRGHMKEDLKRYWYAAQTALQTGVSPKLRDYPDDLLPLHRNARQENKPFDDRFRVQVGNRPSTTVVSHIAKDGHYYIHPDPDQMRSLSVREAARLQTFPDNYYFMGNRTQQYHQVGNAVPPLLANQIAEIVSGVFGTST